MSDRLTNADLKKIHSYMEELEQEEFAILLHKLLTTFNFLVVNGREWKEKSKKCTILEVELIEKEQENITLHRRLEKKQEKITELTKRLSEVDTMANRYYMGYKTAIEREERLKKGIAKLKNEIDNRSNTKNKEK